MRRRNGLNRGSNSVISQRTIQSSSSLAATTVITTSSSQEQRSVRLSSSSSRNGREGYNNRNYNYNNRMAYSSSSGSKTGSTQIKTNDINNNFSTTTTTTTTPSVPETTMSSPSSLDASNSTPKPPTSAGNLKQGCFFMRSTIYCLNGWRKKTTHRMCVKNKRGTHKKQVRSQFCLKSLLFFFLVSLNYSRPWSLEDKS